MQPLPIDSFIPEILTAIAAHGQLILLAEPGAGKTTRVAPAMLRRGLLNPPHARILMLQPRRIAAKAVAQRIAAENAWTLGHEVGYQVRMESRTGPDTPLVIITEGILTRRLLDDPLLEGVGAVILDEFHERSIHSDLALALVNEVRQTVRPDLKLLIMSATLDADPLREFLHPCPVLQAPGRVFPVAVEHLPMADLRLEQRVARAVERALEEAPPGHILVFLPGAAEIRRATEALAPLTQRHDLLTLPLHGSQPLEQQMAALAPSRQRKLILATNLAETSLTIDQVSVVIDSGLVRQAAFDPYRGMDVLHTVRISRASATQRAGRAGRTRPGLCLRLWPASEDRHLAEYDPPEVRRLDLAAPLLNLYAWNRRGAAGISWYENPPADRVAAAQHLLLQLGAIEPMEDGFRLTRLGTRILALPLHPRLGAMLARADNARALQQAALVVAALSEKDFVKESFSGGRRESGDSDILWRLTLLQNFAAGGHVAATIDAAAARRVLAVRDDLLRHLGREAALGLKTRENRADAKDARIAADANGGADQEILRMILAAYPDRACRRRANDPQRALMVGGRGVRMAPTSIVDRAEFFVAVDLDGAPGFRGTARGSTSGRADAAVRMASAIDSAWLAEMFPQEIRTERTLEFNVQRQRVLATRTTMFRDLPLDETHDLPVTPEEEQQILTEELAGRARQLCLRDARTAQLLWRVDFLRRATPGNGLPELTDAAIAAALVAALPPGVKLEAWIAQGHTYAAIYALLDYSQQTLLSRQAPETFALPSGRHAALQYAADGPPVLSAKLQEFFGLSETPRVANGRVPVKLELLGPNYRPVQTTSDLGGFWKSTYALVRKDLRARYPKHQWPEDPAAAIARPIGPRGR